MIEMLQQPGIQAGNTPKNTPKADHVNNDSQSSAKSGGSFDKHLNEQIKRVPAKDQQPVASKKTVENQPDEAAQDLKDTAETVEAEQLVQTDITDEIKLDTESEVLELVVADVALTTTEDPLQTDTDQLLTEHILPLDGNELPPEPVAAIMNLSEAPEQTREQIITSVANAAAKSVKESGIPQQGAAVVAKQLVSNEQAIEQSMFAEEAVEFKMPEIKMQAGQQNAPAQTVGGKLNALFASVAAAASMNQQVPVTTGLTPMHLQATQAPTSATGFLSLPGLSASISAPVQQQGAWSQGLTDQMALMVQGKFQTAEMKLNPAHLGPMEIKLSMLDDKASVTFVTQHAAVREALDVAIPRLREMFESQGLNLANVDVSQYSEQNGKSSDELAEGNGNGLRDKDTLDAQQESVVHESIIHINGQPGLSLYA